jgi:hypothetical protein
MVKYPKPKLLPPPAQDSAPLPTQEEIARLFASGGDPPDWLPARLAIMHTHLSMLRTSHAAALPPKPLRNAERQLRHAAQTNMRILKSAAPAQLVKLAHGLDPTAGLVLALLSFQIRELSTEFDRMLQKLEPPLDARVSGGHPRATADSLAPAEHVAAYVLEGVHRFSGSRPGKTNEEAHERAEAIWTWIGGEGEKTAWEGPFARAIEAQAKGLTRLHAALFDPAIPLDAFKPVL